MRVAVALCVLAVPLPALAQMPVAQSAPSREAQMRPLLDVAALTPGFAFTIFAQAVAEVERADDASRGQSEWALGGEAAWHGDDCHTVAVGGQGRAIKENLSSDASAEQWGHACVGGGFPAPQLELAERYEWQVRPSLAAPRQVLARPFSRAVVSGVVSFIDLPPGDPLTVRLQLGVFGFGWERVSQHEAGYTMFGAEAVAARLWAPRQGPIARSDAVFDILAMGGWIAEPNGPLGMQSMLVVLTPVRVRALRLGTSHLLLDGELSFAGGGFVAPEMKPEVAQLTVPPADVMTVTGSVAIYGGNAMRLGGVGYARSLRPTADGLLMLEDRGTAWLTLRADADQQILEATVQLFAARTEAQAPYGAERATTAGGGFSLGWLLARSMRLGFDAEVARSFYARIDFYDSRPAPELGFRVLWTFSTLFGLGS